MVEIEVHDTNRDRLLEEIDADKVQGTLLVWKLMDVNLPTVYHGLKEP